MTKAQKACWRKTLGVEESNVTFLFLGKKTSWSLFFPSPFHLVEIRPGARMQKSSPSMPPVRFLETLKWFTQVNGSASGKWKCGAGWRRKASFKIIMGSQGWCNPGGWAIFLPMLPSNAAVVPPCQGSTFEIPFVNQNHGPKAKCAVTEGKLCCHHHYVFLLNATMETVNLFLSILSFVLFCFFNLKSWLQAVDSLWGGDSQKLTL